MTTVPPAALPSSSVLLCTLEQGEPLELHPQQPLATIRTHVGAGGVDRIHHLDSIDFWVGDTSAYTHPVNEGATALLTALLSAAATSDYPVSDRERAHAHRVLNSPGAAPVVHGPCVVTGADPDGHPIGLPGAFWPGSPRRWPLTKPTPPSTVPARFSPTWVSTPTSPGSARADPARRWPHRRSHYDSSSIRASTVEDCHDLI